MGRLDADACMLHGIRVPPEQRRDEWNPPRRGFESGGPEARGRPDCAVQVVGRGPIGRSPSSRTRIRRRRRAHLAPETGDQGDADLTRCTRPRVAARSRVVAARSAARPWNHGVDPSSPSGHRRVGVHDGGTDDGHRRDLGGVEPGMGRRFARRRHQQRGLRIRVEGGTLLRP